MWLPPIKVLCAAWIMTALATCTSHPAPVQQPATPPGLPGAGTADVTRQTTLHASHSTCSTWINERWRPISGVNVA